MKKNLPLKQLAPYEVRLCSLSGTVMMGGDWYYEHEGKIILYEAYHQRKQTLKANQFDLSQLEKAQSQIDYKRILKAYEKQVLEQQLDDAFTK